MLDIMDFLVMLLAKRAVLIPLQILGRILEQLVVTTVLLESFHCLRTSFPAHIAPALPMQPPSTAPLVPIKKLPPVMLGIMEMLVMPLVKRVVLVPLQILA